MLCFIVVITEFLLAAKAEASSTENCNVLVSSTCFQQCRDTSCKCGVTYGDSKYATCNQACDDSRAQCKTLTCSSGTCYQKCHNCHMECTSDVGYCRQQCLSGACSFTCNAKRCVQECIGKECNQVTPVTCRTIFPRVYLVILAGLFAATTILSFLALVLSCREMEYWNRRAKYSKLRSVSSSVDSLYSLAGVNDFVTESFVTVKTSTESLWKLPASSLKRDSDKHGARMVP